MLFSWFLFTFQITMSLPPMPLLGSICRILSVGKKEKLIEIYEKCPKKETKMALRAKIEQGRLKLKYFTISDYK